MSYKTIRPTTFDELTMNAAMLLSEFNPETFIATQSIDASKIIGSTTGGVSFADEPEFVDMGEDIDNCPKNTLELKIKQDGNVHVSGNFVTLSQDMLKMLIASADVEGNKIVARTDLRASDFIPVLWAIADYGDGGILAIKMKRVLNTSGFSISTTDQNKAQFAFDFVCHKTITNTSDPAYEVYIITPDSTSESVTINTHSVTVAEGDTVTLTATTVPAGETVTWSTANSSVADVTSGGVVSGEGEGNTIITAAITVDGVTYTDTCTVVVTAEEEEG